MGGDGAWMPYNTTHTKTIIFNPSKKYTHASISPYYSFPVCRDLLIAQERYDDGSGVLVVGEEGEVEVDEVGGGGGGGRC